MSGDCDGVDPHAELWAKVRAALEGAGFDFDALVSRAAETLEQYRRNLWRCGAPDDVGRAGDYEHQMHVGAWRIDAFSTAAGWRSVCERPSIDSAPAGARFGPFASRDRARRVALFHALWLDGLLTEEQAVAMLEGRADVAGGQRTADEAPDETVRLVHRLGAAAAAMNAGDVLPMTAGDFEHAKDTIAALLAEVRRARSELTAARVGGEDVADGIRLLAAGREDARRERDAACGEAAAHPSGRAEVVETGGVVGPCPARETMGPPCCLRCEPGWPFNTRMVLCRTCGNKRCPRATDHLLGCTGSNEPGQPGSAYETDR